MLEFNTLHPYLTLLYLEVLRKIIPGRWLSQLLHQHKTFCFTFGQFYLFNRSLSYQIKFISFITSTRLVPGLCFQHSTSWVNGNTLQVDFQLSVSISFSTHLALSSWTAGTMLCSTLHIPNPWHTCAVRAGRMNEWMHAWMKCQESHTSWDKMNDSSEEGYSLFPWQNFIHLNVATLHNLYPCPPSSSNKCLQLPQ